MERIIMNRVRAGLRIPMDLNTKLILCASENGISKNVLILQILWEYFEKKVGYGGRDEKAT